MSLAYSQENWEGCLESLGFTEGKNVSFGGMVVYDNKGIPQWTYDTEEEKKQLYIFFSGAVYWQVHTMFN